MIDLYVHVRATGKAANIPAIAEIGMATYEGDVLTQAFSLLVKPGPGEVIPPLWTHVTHSRCVSVGMELRWYMPVVRKLLSTSTNVYAYDLDEQMALLQMMHQFAEYEWWPPLERHNLRMRQVDHFQHSSAAAVCGMMRRWHIEDIHRQEREQEAAKDRPDPRRSGRNRYG